MRGGVGGWGGRGGGWRRRVQTSTKHRCLVEVGYVLAVVGKHVSLSWLQPLLREEAFQMPGQALQPTKMKIRRSPVGRDVVFQDALVKFQVSGCEGKSPPT